MTLRIRASSLAEYQDCPRRWAAKSLWREIEAAGFTLRWLPLGIGAAVGTGVHAGAAYLLNELRVTGEIGDGRRVKDGQECAVVEFRGSIRDGYEPDTITRNDKEGVTTVTNMVDAYAPSIDPECKPVLIEHRLTIKTPAGAELTGKADLMVADGTIADLKTGKSKPRAAPQLGAYSLMARAHGHNVSKVAVDWQPRAKPDKDQVAPRRMASVQGVAEREALAITDHATRDATAFLNTNDPTNFIPRPQSFLCSAKYCPAWGTNWCNAWRSE